MRTSHTLVVVAALALWPSLALCQSQTIIQQGTLTTNTPAISTTATWNEASTTFAQLKMDITDTASTNGSRFLDLQNGGVTVAHINKAGAGDLRIGTNPPAGAVSDTSGTVVGSQSSSRDAKNIEGPFTDYRSALDTIVRTNLYNFTSKTSGISGPKFVGLVTDESPRFGQDADEAHPNGRALNVVNSIGYLMAAIKAQQADIEALRSEVARLKQN